MKTTIARSITWACSLVATACFYAPAVQAQDNPQEQWNNEYRSDYEVPLGNYTGRSPYMSSKPMVRQAPAPKPVYVPPPAVAPAPAPKTTCGDPTWGLIRMNKTMPAEASLGAEFMAELRLTAQACAANVVVRDTVPVGTSYVRSEPAASVDGNQLTWPVGNLESGESRNIKLWLKAEKEGTLVNCASVSADPRTCAATFVGKATLTIEKSGPATALLGADVTYNVVVKNTGSAIARNVVITDAVPEGMGGQPVTVNVGDLAPGQSKPMTVTFKANQRGKVCNTAVANSSNAGKVSDDACTVVQQPGLKIVKNTNDKKLLINRTASYVINVQNTGDTTLTGVVVTDTAAAGTTIVEAVGGSVSGSVATWNLGELAAGASKDLTVKISSKQPGNFCNTAAVATTQGLKGSSQACTEWIGVTGVLVEVVDDPDPIQVGETSTYTIKVTNQSSSGTVDELDIVAMFPSEVTPASASGNGAISGKTVTFPQVATLAPKASVTYTIVGKAGDARLKVEVKTRSRQNAIEENESTTVY
jgi:uncharacterized repeat protein (TIGR01451 family)